MRGGWKWPWILSNRLWYYEWLHSTIRVCKLPVVAWFQCVCCQVSSCYCVYICSNSLQECKQTLREYLTKLELAGLVSSADGYQSIVSAIAEDICNKHRQRKLRRKVMCCIFSTLVLMNARHGNSKWNVCHTVTQYEGKSDTSNHLY